MSPVRVMELPPDIQTSLLRALSSFLNGKLPPELPASIRRFRGFRPQALNAHRDRIFGALDDGALRAEILEWLTEARPKLSDFDRVNLEIACERADGWEARLAARSRAGRGDSEGEDLRAAAERAREREERARRELKKARADLKEAREDAARAAGEARARTAALEARVAELETGLRATRAELEEHRAAAATQGERAARELRKARREVERARAASDELRRAAKEERRTAAAAAAEKARLEREVQVLEASLRRHRRRSRSAPSYSEGGRRRPIDVPRGRFEDDPQTLDEWLEGDGVRLLIDGYNVARAPGAFGELGLQLQRDRLVAEVARLATRKGISTTVVFDGSDVAPGLSRRLHGPVAVEYSRPDETADDHLVALLESLPPEPVVVVTNDRELQGRAAARGATIATSNQLLALLR